MAAHLVDPQGVLHDPCEPNCGEDGIQFKGILVRNLVTLEHASPSPEALTLLDKNAESVWTNARTEDGHFSTDWAGPAQNSVTGSLISALDALTAAGVRLSDEQPRTGIRGSQVAFIHPSSTGGILTEIVQP